MSTEIEIVGYLRASQEGQPEWSEDCVCVDAVYPNYEGDESVSMPICRLADAQAIIAQRDARISELERDLSLAHMACELAEEELAALKAGQGEAVLWLLEWAVDRWHAEVSQRPLVNAHRRILDDTWRQMIRKLGGDPVDLCGPAHDTLLSTTNHGEPQ